MAHAILSASASSRWLHCTPSARLERKFPDASSPYALEGSRAHERAEYFLNRFLKTGDSNVLIREDVEMNDAVQAYVNICVEKINEARTASPDAQIKVEQRLDFSRWVPEGFGTGDTVMVSDKYLKSLISNTEKASRSRLSTTVRCGCTHSECTRRSAICTEPMKSE